MGKSSSAVVGYHYRPAFHGGIGRGPIDAYLEFRGGDRTAWAGTLTASGTISINSPNLFGGEKDQGGIVGDVDVLFGDADQMPNAYLLATFGSQVPAWRGVTTVVFKGGRYGAMNPYPQKASHKIRKILQGWDGEGCWYPEKAEIAMLSVAGDQTPWVDDVDPRDPFSAYEYRCDDGDWKPTLEEAIAQAVSLGEDAAEFTNYLGWSADAKRLARAYGFSPDDEAVLVMHFNRFAVSHPTLSYESVMGTESTFLACGPMEYAEVEVGSGRYWWCQETTDATPTFPADAGLYQLVSFDDMPNYPHETVINNCTNYPSYMGHFPKAAVSYDRKIEVRRAGYTLFGMNPAHVLYYIRTDSEYGREPRENINEASLTAAANQLFTEGFGICTAYDPSQESPLEFENRICQLIGGSFGRSLTDGEWYLDLARGNYTLGSLPVLADDDILEFKELPTTLDGAVNSVAVKYFDPERKEEMVTPAVRALGLIRRFGENHLVLECPEIPTAGLALRKAEMELRSRTTPTRAFDLVTTRRSYAWRPNQYFRLQSPKRGIADMVCIVGEIGTGTLRSGAIRLKATQDIYSLPTTSYVAPEGGVDTRPSPVPVRIAHQAAFEAPYIELAQRMRRADLDALPVDAGYLLTVAADPAQSRDYTVMVAGAGGSFDEQGNGEWCPTAVLAGTAEASESDTVFELAGATGLASVSVGDAVLWDGEICRVDAIDIATPEVTLGRGCADTVPIEHADGSRLWFYSDRIGGDWTEFTDGEDISVKLLTNTSSRQLTLTAAVAMPLTFDQRQSRPYPPGRFRIDGVESPASVSGDFVVTWAHRDRLQQADQLVDAAVASIGPEATTRYGMRLLDAVGAVLVSRDDIAGATATVDLDYTGDVTLELYSITDRGESWVRVTRTFAYTEAGATSNTIVAPVYEPEFTIIDGGEIT